MIIIQIYFLIYMENSPWKIQPQRILPRSRRRPDQNTKMMVMKDIRAKWSHFSEQDVAALKGKAELVNQVAAKYGLEQAQAQKDVDALLKGRPFGAAQLGQQRPKGFASARGLGPFSIHGKSVGQKRDGPWLWGSGASRPKA